ncbi:MAG: nucleotidyltransferase domain-containing protein [Candidatus Tectomicrobia bacterium]|uniref:Nucleotidyltransferase domain-containing protein n=1 Tax=Tectimicrobiota bacterium TaxID=2528274 RepID=A0A932CM02_UNCTE|nr:nucleotidyltransferase domain-containing protein [Candidatus Tectomicrobia bacterium]
MAQTETLPVALPTLELPTTERKTWISYPQQETLKQAIMALQAALGDGLMSVVLFGSRSRGEAHEGSDWDLLIIAEGLPEKPFERRLFLKRLLPPGCVEAVSFLARTPEEFEGHIPSLYLDIALDGQILYDPRGYATERLSMLRHLIDRMGLYRERTEAGDLWRWRKEPHGPWALEWGK